MNVRETSLHVFVECYELIMTSFSMNVRETSLHVFVECYELIMTNDQILETIVLFN
jgi:uncharacterized protein with NAD-binding domain and iron-sulfur cluster